MAPEYNNLEKIRLEKIQRLRDQGIEPFPTRAERTHTSLEAIQAFEAAETAGQVDSVKASLTGRIRAMRPWQNFCSY
jgi:lysyl-tRNA synthetase class 2